MKDDTDFRKAFGLRVKELRKKRGWTQKKLSTQLGVRFGQLNKYECGLHIPPADKLIRLAEVFNTTVDYLLTGDNEGKSPLHNLRLLERLKAVERFKSDDQETIIKLIDAMIIKHRTEMTMKPTDRT